MPRSVLLVESDSTIRKYLGDLLRRGGHPCTSVASLGAALRELGERPYLTIIADLDLAGDDAGGLAARLRRACPGACLIGLQSSAELPGGAQSDGAFDTIIVKPFVADPLLAILPALAQAPAVRVKA